MDATRSWFTGARGVLALWSVFFVVSVLGNGIFGQWLVRPEPVDFGVETTRTAAAILHYGEFRDPFAPMPTGPTAHVAPAYPLLYSAVVKVFGDGTAGWIAIRLLTLAVYALSLALLPWLAIALGLSQKTGLLAAIIGSLAPIPGSCYKWEALYTALLLVGVALLFLKMQTPDGRIRTAIFAGAVIGVTLLFSPSVVLVICAWCLLLLRKVGLKAVALAAAVPILVITPWLIRDYKVFNAIIFIRGNLGTELASSNNDCGSAWSDVDKTNNCFAQNHPNANLQMAQRIAEVGEYRFNQERRAVAMSWIRAHPANFCVLTLKRIVFFWFPALAGGKTDMENIGQWMVSLLTLASIPGLLVLYRSNRFAAWFLVACLALFPLSYYVIHVNLRYRYPILWVTCLGAASLFTERKRSSTTL